MLNEAINGTLAEIFKEFDRHSQITNTKYSIDADYPDFQGYTVLKCPDFDGFLRHITNYVKDYQVYMTVNGIHFKYDYLNDRGFHLPRRKTNLITFSILPIQENNMGKPENTLPQRKCQYCGHEGRWRGPCPQCGPEDDELEEDQYKSPTTKQRLQQNSRNRSKYNPGKTAFENVNFEDRLKAALQEEVDFVSPDVLFSKPFGFTEPTPTIDPMETIRSTAPMVQQQIHNYLMALEHAPENMAPEIEDLIGGCNRLLGSIERITGGSDGTFAAQTE